jgi:hypothetical protein
MTVADKPQRKKAATVDTQRSSGLTPWKPGQSGNPKGRPVGSRTKLEEAFVADYCAAWAKHGAEVLEILAVKEPAKFAQVAASILPKHTHHKVEDLKYKSDAELAALIQAGLGERAVTSQLPKTGTHDTKH